MSRTLASLVFYARFLPSFSRLGYLRKVRGEPATPGAFAGQRWVVSGASDGIGRAIALGAAAFGARVCALGRNPAKLQALQQDGVGERIEPVVADLSLVAETRALVARLATQGHVDVLVNNVGVMLHDYTRTVEGVETSVATNLLCPFLLTEGLREAGALDADSVVISVSSGGMYGARLDLDRLEAASAEGHDGFMAYAQHKRAQAELTRYWNQLEAPKPRALLMHPGWVDTGGVRSSLPTFRRRLRAVLRSAEEGADTVLWLAQQRPAPSAQGGIWLDRRREDEHAFAFTRGGAASGQLAGWLRQRAARLMR
jgi:dehydrogenase/reductase SDR family member 12